MANSPLRWAAMLLPAFVGALGTMPARAAQPAADLALVLAVDVSWSMDSTEQHLQRQGYIDAFRDPAVLAAIKKGDVGRIAVTYLEWAGVDQHQVVLPWTIVDSADSAERVASALEEAPISRMRRTSISTGLLTADALFPSSGVDATRKAIDVSGDGPNNAGEPVTIARDQLVHEGVVINGLPIMIYQGDGGGDYFGRANLDKYYKNCVIGGSGSFMIIIQHPEQFGEAIRRKLILEIAGARPRVMPAQFTAPHDTAGANCLEGEERWGHWQGNP